MNEIKSYNEGLDLLKDGEVLVYKPFQYKAAFLIYKDENKVAVYNEFLHYIISYADLKDIFNEFKVYLFEKDNELEIDEEFKKLRQ